MEYQVNHSNRWGNTEARNICSLERIYHRNLRDHFQSHRPEVFTWCSNSICGANLESVVKEELVSIVWFPRGQWNCIRKKWNQKQVGERPWVSMYVLLITQSPQGMAPSERHYPGLPSLEWLRWQTESRNCRFHYPPHAAAEMEHSLSYVRFSVLSKLNTVCQFLKS